MIVVRVLPAESHLPSMLPHLTRAHERVCQQATLGAAQRLLRRWSKDQRVIAMSAGGAELYTEFKATKQAMGTRSMDRELVLRLDVMELEVDANAATRIVGRQELGKIRHLDLSYWWLQASE